MENQHNSTAGSNLVAISSASPVASRSEWNNWPTEADIDAGLRPHRSGKVVEVLTRCLALVKPVGMTDADAEAWLSAAADEVREVPADLLERAARDVRQTCTHHGQIVPAIFGNVRETWRLRKEARERLAPKPPTALVATLDKPQRWIPLPGELDEIKRQVAHALRASR